MATPDVSVLQRSDLNDFLFAVIGTEASGMTLSVLSALARQGSDPWREASRLAHLPKAEAGDSLAHTIADMPRSVWSLSDAMVIATRLIALLPARPARGERRALPLNARVLPSVRTIAMIVCMAVGLGYFAWVMMRPAPASFDGSDVASFSALPASPAPASRGAAARSVPNGRTVPSQDLNPGRVATPSPTSGNHPMSMASAKDGDDPQHEADRQARAMNDGLRKDVKAWSAARSGTASRAADEFGVPPAVPPSPARRVKKAKPVVEAKPAPAIGKPFRMSYDGVTTTEHIAERLARGAR